jgi:hypothetical protein
MSNLPVDEILDTILWLPDEYFHPAVENLSRLFISFQCIYNKQLRTEYTSCLIL